MENEIIFPVTDLDVIYKCIPQRSPMVMIDGLLNYNSEAVIATLTVSQNNIFLENIYLTEAGLIEHMAQSVALHTGFGFFLREEEAPIGYIGSINNLEIFSRAEIGQQIQTQATILQEFSGVTLVEIRSNIGTKLIAKGQMKTVIAK